MLGEILSIAGPIIGGLFGSSSANRAAQMQAQAADQAIAEQRRQYNQSRADLEPWRTAGGAAVGQLSDLLGLGADQGPQSGALNRKFTLSDFWNDPVTQASYQSGLDLGQQAIDRMAGARGGRNSGATLKALSRFGTDYTGQQAAGSQARYVGDQTNLYNRLAGVAGTGQTAATNTGQMGMQMAGNVGNLLTGTGNARGAAAIAGGNALQGGLNTISNMWGQRNMLNQLQGMGLSNQYGYGNIYGTGGGGVVPPIPADWSAY